MSLSNYSPTCARFHQFQVDLSSGVLQRSGVRVPVQAQPLQVLRLLLQADGKVVTREELRKVLWPEDTFVDFELGVNTAVKKLRQALADPADRPKFIETLPKIGYRFLAPVEWVTEDGQEGLTPKVQGSAPSNGVGVTSVPENHGRAAHVVDLERRSAVTKKWVWLENRPTSGSESAAKPKSLHALAFLGAVILLTAGGLWIFKRREAPAVPHQRTLTRITFDEGLQNEPTWSPDGRYIAYSSDRGGKLTSGCSRSAAAILYRSPKDRGIIGSRTGRGMANTSHIVPRKGTVEYMLSRLSGAPDSNGRSRLSATTPSGHRTAYRCCFRLILL